LTQSIFSKEEFGVKMKSSFRNFAIAAIAAIAMTAAAAVDAQTPTLTAGTNPVIAASAIADPVIAETTLPNFFSKTPESASSSSLGFVMPVPARQPNRNIGAKALSLFAWPGYGMAGDSRDEDEQGLKTILIVERGTAFFDGASTYIMLDTPYLPNAIRAIEADPLLTLFGNRNKVGVLATGSFLEVLVNHGSVAIPRMFERKLGPHAGHVARIGTILADGTLSMVHIQLAIFNLKNTARLMQSVNAVKGN
jgi:hypothetical protein